MNEIWKPMAEHGSLKLFEKRRVNNANNNDNKELPERNR